jgi:hypothetical protein
MLTSVLGVEGPEVRCRWRRHHPAFSQERSPRTPFTTRVIERSALSAEQPIGRAVTRMMTQSRTVCVVLSIACMKLATRSPLLLAGVQRGAPFPVGRKDVGSRAGSSRRASLRARGNARTHGAAKAMSSAGPLERWTEASPRSANEAARPRTMSGPRPAAMMIVAKLTERDPILVCWVGKEHCPGGRM